ncbi:hypothetical protein CYY_008829 [Polysphondylium violaceum]|uniref:NADH dehydrogenase [ubiquinone] iron-sulfur protein 5 n=1 Tax=Polysphondylium violaceum TaxID=133409 RepID=A0A8J4PUK2_9MYCE|nr:hypothetical protein CYY_008829 [Polysphondylium violaceum]
MASGFGPWGGVGKCYPMWSDFCTCIYEKPLELCTPYRADYMECISNTKEYKSQLSENYHDGSEARLAKVREAIRRVNEYEPKVGKAE